MKWNAIMPKGGIIKTPFKIRRTKCCFVYLPSSSVSSLNGGSNWVGNTLDKEVVANSGNSSTLNSRKKLQRYGHGFFSFFSVPLFKIWMTKETTSFGDAHVQALNHTQSQVPPSSFIWLLEIFLWVYNVKCKEGAPTLGNSEKTVFIHHGLQTPGSKISLHGVYCNSAKAKV